MSNKSESCLYEGPRICCKTNPSPCRLASVHSHVGLAWSKKASVGAEVRDFLAVWKAWSVPGDQANSFFGAQEGS